MSDRRPPVLAWLLLLALLAICLAGCVTVDRCLDVAASCAPPSRVTVVSGECRCEAPPVEPTPAPNPAPSVPLPIPPEPGPLPTPGPAPQPSEPPSPSAPPAPAPPCAPLRDCGLDEPQGDGGIWGCCSEHRRSRYEADVAAAVEAVLGRPLLGAPRVADEAAFMAAVVARLRAQGYCASRGGPEDEIAVKRDDDYSEQFDLLIGSQFENGQAVPRYPAAFHTVSCSPARF